MLSVLAVDIDNYSTDSFVQRTTSIADMDDKSQYDSLLGGSHELPPFINLMKFTAARCKEIETMRKSASTSSSLKLAFQKLPKHMRRRVMSHNAKRVPRRIREMHLSQMKKAGLPPKQKRPSRKYRRRPRNLMDEYERRKRRVRWLDTHIWHAKRFHMVEKWGWKIPDRPCDKAFRACYRATAKHCLLEDISYFTCVEIEGPLEILVGNLKTICDCSTLSMGAVAYRKGTREGETVLYKYNVFPKKAIGTVYFHWFPSNVAASAGLWIWVHAAFYEDVLETLVNCLKLECNSMEVDSNINSTRSFMNTKNNILLSELKNELSRFRLTGPLAHSVLQRSLKFSTQNIKSNWLKDYLSKKDNERSFFDQINYWHSIRNIASSSELPSHCILSLTVTDPRFSRPQKRTKATTEHFQINIENLCAVPNNVCHGPIWSRNIRKLVSVSKISNAAIAEERRQLLVPGTDLPDAGMPVPIILIQQPGSGGYLGYCAGWDVILPSSYSQAFWMSFIMWGARAGGLREMKSMKFEMGLPDFLTPDSDAGREEEIKCSECCRDTFFKLPPGKRPNYTKFSIASPFNFEWKMLLSEWKQGNCQDFFVLRDKKILLHIQQQFAGKNTERNGVDIDLNSNCLVPVLLKFTNKGVAPRFSIICLSEPGDEKTEPVEPIKEDVNAGHRKKLRLEHRILLQKLRKRRIKAKNDGEIIPVDTEVLEEYKNKMRELWLPKPDTIRNSCSREIIGFVTDGGFSFVRGQTSAVGYIAIGSISTLLSKRDKNKVLVRNTNSRQYKLAKLDIIV